MVLPITLSSNTGEWRAGRCRRCTWSATWSCCWCCTRASRSTRSGAWGCRGIYSCTRGGTRRSCWTDRAAWSSCRRYGSTWSSRRRGTPCSCGGWSWTASSQLSYEPENLVGRCWVDTASGSSLTHVMQRLKPPPGFSQAAGLLDWTVRSFQYHWPPTAKSMLA